VTIWLRGVVISYEAKFGDIINSHNTV